MWVKSFRRLVPWDPGVAAAVTLQHLCKEPSCDGVSGVDRFGDVGRVSLPPPWEWVILPMVLDGMGGPELYSKPGSACSPPQQRYPPGITAALFSTPKSSLCTTAAVFHLTLVSLSCFQFMF